MIRFDASGLVLSVFRAGAKSLASGRRVEVRRNRSHATRPQGATSTRRPGAGHWSAEEDCTAQDRLRASSGPLSASSGE